jgi:hypothetical protein
MLFVAAHEFGNGPERRLLQDNNTSEISGKAEVPGTRSKRR